MKKIEVSDFIYHSHVDDHDKIKDNVLFEISKAFDDNASEKDSYYEDSVSKLDYGKCTHKERPWLKICLPGISREILKFGNECGYREVVLKDIWYQQYKEGDTHGWHIHGHHFTGVYYLEHPKGSSRTEICSPLNLKSQSIDTKEGDLVIFPSHWIHRGPPNRTERKTIISYNLRITPESGLDIAKIRKGKPYIFF